VLQVGAEVLHLVRDAIDDHVIAGRLTHLRPGQLDEFGGDPVRLAERVDALEEGRRERVLASAQQADFRAHTL